MNAHAEKYRHNGAVLFHALTCTYVNGDKLGSAMELVSTSKGDYVSCIVIIQYILNILLIIMKFDKLRSFVCMYACCLN